MKNDDSLIFFVQTKSAHLDISNVQLPGFEAVDLRTLAPHFSGEISSVSVSFDLGIHPSWRILLNELLRQLSDVTVKIRYVESTFLTHYELANFLFHAQGPYANVELKCSIEKNGHACAAVISIGARLPVSNSEMGISIGVIHNGEKPENLHRLIESCNTEFSTSPFPWEIVLNGPRIESIAELWPEVSQISSVSDPRGWITRKKNHVAQFAKYDNLLMLHNRYALPKGFANTYTSLQNAFQIVIPRQIGENFELPTWVCQSSQWGYATSIEIPYGSFHPYQYVSGGAFLVKRALLLNVPLNELLFWDEAEDLEWSRRLQGAGVIPRGFENFFLESLGYRDGLLNGFQKVTGDVEALYPLGELHLGNPFSEISGRGQKAVRLLRRVGAWLQLRRLASIYFLREKNTVVRFRKKAE
jgi:hypothetical protein